MTLTQIPAQEPPPPPSSAVAVRPPVTPFGVTPQNLDDAWRFAQMLSKSDLVPKEYRGKPENVMVAMQYGAEVGLPPMAALQSVAVINGRPGLFGDGFLAVIMATPAYAGHQEVYLVGGEERERLTAADVTQDDTAARCRFWRKGQAQPVSVTFSIADARKAGLAGKPGPWTEYPARMLRMRARGFAGRDAFAAELRGMATVEELRDIPPSLDPPRAPDRVKPDGYDLWIHDLTAVADEGAAAFEQAFHESDPHCREYLTKTQIDTWAALKARVAAADTPRPADDPDVL